MTAECMCGHCESEHDPREPGQPQRCRVRHHYLCGAHDRCDCNIYEPCSCPGLKPDKEDNE